MKYLLAILAFCVVLLGGCLPDDAALDLRDAVAVDLALATMSDRTPQPRPEPPTPYNCPRCKDTGWITHGDGHRTPCPDCSDGIRGDYSGPLDTWRDAKDLIRKGNELANRGKQLLDRAERDGKICVDILLPKPNLESQPVVQREPVSQPCPADACSVVPPPPKRTAPTIVTQQAAPSCTQTYCQPRVFWRWRR
jgi:hypothetical protein